MRSLLALVLVPALAVGAPARKPVIAFLPATVSHAKLSRLSHLMEARAAVLLEATGRYSELHVKQVTAMAGQEGLDVAHLSDDVPADQARVLIGADRVVAVKLTVAGDGVEVSGSVRDAKQPVPFKVKVSGGWPEALTQGSEAIARAVLAQDQAALPAGAKAQPESSSDAALKALGKCWETALQQPLGIDNPVTLPKGELAQAITACQQAVAADATLSYANGTLALLLAFGREDAKAEEVLKALGDGRAALEPWALARFYLLTRNTSAEAGVTFLESVLKDHPGELVLRAYLGDTLASMNEHARAVTAWKSYLEVSPSSAYAHGRLSRSLARLGQLDAAIAAAKQGLDLVPTGRDARLQLGSRLLDAKKLDEATAILKPMAELPDAPSEHLLRLGWAYWLAGKGDQAKPLFEVAAERARGSSAWRTKGRALYNLALVEQKAGKLDAAKAAYKRSVATGFVAKDPPKELLEAKAEKAPPPPPSGLYISQVPVVLREGVAPALGPLGEATLREGLVALGAAFPPPTEEKEAALALVREKHLKGYQLHLQLVPAPDKGLTAILLVASYPEKALKGSWTVSASGATPEELVKVVVPRVLEDIAGDLGWKP